jgi:hypothetical protein
MNTLPTPVRGMGWIGKMLTGTAARSGERGRIHSTSSAGSTFTSGLNWT